MRCQQCDYPLWNLKTRACPECGRAFKPSDHEFVPNSVRFCCRDCDKPYYGTGARGHLVPASFKCIQCGATQTMDEMVLRPTAGIEEEETRVETTPWLDRRRMGRAVAWFRTLGRSMVMPAGLIRGVPPERGHGQAWWYATLTLAIILSCGAGLPFLIIGLIDVASGGNDALQIIGVAGIFAGSTVASALIALLLWGLVTHVVLRLTGGTSYGLGRTYQALCYSAGATVTMAVPCIGIYPFAFVGLLWWLVSSIMMLAVGQRVHPGRAVFAAMVFPVLLGIGVSVGGAGLTMYGLTQAKAMAAKAGQVTQDASCQIIVDALVDYATRNNAWPAHAFAMVPGDMMTTSDFIVAGSTTFAGSVPIADTTLDVAAGMTPGARRVFIDALVAAQPPDLVVHRVGDFVFTYHGIDATDADDALWLVILSPDPASNIVNSINDTLLVGLADGTVASFAEAEFAQALADQNDLREDAGLPPLPDPSTVVHAGP